MKKIIDTSKTEKNETSLLIKKEAKTSRRESVKRRRKVKKQDKLARWSGLILLIILMLVGFLLWVGGEVGVEKKVNENVSMPTFEKVIIE